VKSKVKKLDVVFWTQITTMLGTLNLYLDSKLTFIWWQASVILTKGFCKGAKFTQNIHEWLHTYLQHNKLLMHPMHHYGCYHSSVLEDEDIQETIH